MCRSKLPSCILRITLRFPPRRPILDRATCFLFSYRARSSIVIMAISLAVLCSGRRLGRNSCQNQYPYQGKSADSDIYLGTCSELYTTLGLNEAAKLGRVKGHSPEAARQAEKQRQHAAAVKSWHPSDKPEWLTEKAFREQIQPRLAAITVPVISSALGVSEPYASLIRAKRYLPHPRHWVELAKLVGFNNQ